MYVCRNVYVYVYILYVLCFYCTSCVRYLSSCKLDIFQTLFLLLRKRFLTLTDVKDEENGFSTVKREIRRFFFLLFPFPSFIFFPVSSSFSFPYFISLFSLFFFNLSVDNVRFDFISN